jgi:PadR family transcriptional regulator PadR
MADALGLFEQAVLVALIRLEGRAYGRAILNEVQTRLKRDVTAGAVYATLDRLEAKRLVSSRLAPGTAIRGGRARRYYLPSAAGIQALNEAKASADDLWRGLNWPLKARA